jgi:LysM repeat protein
MILNNFFEPRKKSIVEDLDQPTQLLPGLNQTIDSKTGLTTRKYSMGPTNVKQITDPKGKILSTDAEVDYGIGKFAFGQAGGITSKAYTPAPGQEGMSGRDLYSMGNANKAATYDRATAAVNETPRAPGSPALATPKAPRAPAAPRLEEDDVDPPDGDFDSWEQNGDTAVPVTKGGVRQNLYKTPVSQVPQGAKITQKYNTYQQQGAHAFPVEPQGGIDQLSKIPLSQVPKGANIVQAPTPSGNLYKNLPATPALEEDDQPLDMDLVKQIYRNNKDIIGANPNIIEPKTMIDLPDGTPYEIQPGDTLSKIARNIPAIKAAAAASNKIVAAEPSFLDKLKQAASGIAAGQFPSRAIPDAFPSLKKPATTGAAPVVKAAPDPVAVPRSIVKAPPEMVAPVDSMDPGEEIVVKSKVKPHLPPRTPSPEPFMPPVAQPRFPHVPSPQPFMPAGANPERPKPPYVPTPTPTGKEPPPSATPTGIPAATDKLSRLEKGAETKIGQAYDWLANLVKGRESGGDYDIGYHYDPGTGKIGADKRKSSAYGAYGMTQAYIDNARKLDPALDKPLDKWTSADQDRAFQLGTASNVKRMSTLGVDFTKHPEAPSIAHALGPDGAADYFKTGKLSQEAIDQNGGEKKLKAIIAQRTKDARDAIELQKKQQEKQKTKESAVAETVQTVKVMLETATTRDDVRRIKDYIDRQYTRHGLSDSVSFAQRNHLVERVIEITAKRRILT